jgi:hypothetical protein
MADAHVVTSDSLQVGLVLVAGESSVAAAVGDALQEGAPADVLPQLGVEWVVIYADDRDADDVDTAGLEIVFDGDLIDIYRVPDAAAPEQTTATTRRTAVLAAHLIALLVTVGALTTLLAARSRHGNTEGRARRTRRGRRSHVR